jgi:hypothetical protein
VEVAAKGEIRKSGRWEILDGGQKPTHSRQWGCRISGFRISGIPGDVLIIATGLFFELHYANFQNPGFMNELIHFPLRRPLVPPILKIIS